MTQASLDFSAHARAADPLTSIQAAESVTNLNAKREAVYKCLLSLGPMTDEQLCLGYHRMSQMPGWIVQDDPYVFPRQSDSGIRTRRSELVRAERCKDSGRREKSSGGRGCIVWQAV